MFALSNLSQVINNLPQVSVLTKYGMLQSSTFTPVKKIPELDIVYGELASALNLIKDKKYEKLLDYLSRLKYGAGVKASELLNNENFVKIIKKIQNSNIPSKNKLKGTKESVTGCEKIYSEKYSQLGSNSCGIIITNESTDLLREIKPNDIQCAINENKQFLSITSQLIPNLNDSNRSIFNKSCFYVSPVKGFHLLSNLNGNYQGQRRGFKTQKQLESEYKRSFWGVLMQLRKMKSDNIGGMNETLNEIISKDSTGNSTRAREEKIQRLRLLGAYIESSLNLLRIICILAVLTILSELARQVPLGRSTAPTKAQDVNVTFDDAKGMEEAKAELKYIVEYLRDPSKFQNIGGKMPTGILLQGPPGTGKTLLARAVAGEANVNFYYVKGSEFDEIYVGEGARRMRNVFEMVRKNAPAVLFIDEIDAVGEKRVSHSLQPHANQTITQLLTEMDGFVKNDKIIVIGATNRFYDLDEALLRPGRFDAKITLRKPTLAERKEILQLYVNKVVSRGIDVEYFAKRAVGFTGAELENLVNQAAIIAASDGCSHVGSNHMDQAFDKIILGPALLSLERTEDMDMVTAYHESGHAVVAFFTPGGNLPVKVTITPRGNTLGHTALLKDEKFSQTKAEFLAQIDVSLGGRAAEELIFGAGNVTNACLSDLQSATQIATEMVKYYGMSEKGGLRTYDTRVGRYRKLKEYGQKATDVTDEEIKNIIQESYERAKALLRKYSVEHKLLAEALMEKETLDSDEIRKILSQGETRQKSKG